MTNVKRVAGFDVSKNSIDLYLPPVGTAAAVSGRFSYDAEGLAAISQALGSTAVHGVLEATGPYHLKLAFYLYEQGHEVSVVNPLAIKRFGQMLLTRTKTDRADARLIAAYGVSQQPGPWTPPAAYRIELGHLQALGELYQKHRTALLGQQEAFSASGLCSQDLAAQLAKTLSHCDDQIEAVAQKMEQIIIRHHKELLSVVTSIPGIGKKTAIALIILSDGFKKFTSYKQLSAYIGLCPRIYESGTSVKGKARICKMGMSRIRALLYVCTWSAKQHNKGCKDLYDRMLQNGKPKKVALIAVANKLLKQAFAIATSNTPYQKNYSKNICS